MYFAKVLIPLLVYFGTTISKEIEIGREIQNADKSKWDEVHDRFYIPPSACQQQNSQIGDYCTAVCNTGETDTSNRYSCSCTDKKASTLTYHNNQWRCRKNEEVRNKLGCEVNTMFHGEKTEHRIRTLNVRWPRKTKIDEEDCYINISSSWFIGCYGEKMSLGNSSIFHLKWEPSRSGCFIKVKDVEPINSLKGQIINLGIRRSTLPLQDACLLFKLEGSINCLVEKPPVQSPSSSIVPTASSPHFFAKTSTIFLKRSSSQPTTSSSQPGSGKRQEDDDVSSSPPLGLITGVTVSIVIVLLLTAAFCFYRRCKSRKDAQKGTTGQSKKEKLKRSLHTNAAFHPETQNGYVTSNNTKLENSSAGEFYASLDVPEGHIIYGPGNAQEPFYNVLQEPSSGNEEDGQNYGTIRLEQAMYNVLEDLSGMGPGKAEEDGPNRVEPVYNVLEEPYPGNAERSQHYGAISVNDPFYNTLEESQGRNGPQGTNDEPVYNTLEEPYPSSAAEDDSYGPKGLQDHVYNVLEGRSTDEIDSNIPTYAMVNKKKR